MTLLPALVLAAAIIAHALIWRHRMAVTPEVAPIIANIDGLTTKVATLIAAEVAAAVAPVQTQLDSAREVLSAMDAKVAGMAQDHADDVAGLTASVGALAAALTPSPAAAAATPDAPADPALPLAA